MSSPGRGIFVHHNPGEITREFSILGKPGEQEGKVYEGVHILDAKNVYIAAGASVKPGVVLDAEGGPIFIDEGAKIFPQAVIEGPAYIGKKSAIKIAAKIYEGTSIGEVCKVGGELEESIIHSYSNKQHDGFLGHAYLGMWVNLGADTNNSDLKNDYGPVKCVIDGELVNTGSQFVGLTMGDHSKSGINSMFNTGTVVGMGCNIYGAGLPPKYVPSFAWGGADGLMEYRADKFIAVAKARHGPPQQGTHRRRGRRDPQDPRRDQIRARRGLRRAELIRSAELPRSHSNGPAILGGPIPFPENQICELFCIQIRRIQPPVLGSWKRKQRAASSNTHSA